MAPKVADGLGLRLELGLNLSDLAWPETTKGSSPLTAFFMQRHLVLSILLAKEQETVLPTQCFLILWEEKLPQWQTVIYGGRALFLSQFFSAYKTIPVTCAWLNLGGHTAYNCSGDSVESSV